MPTFPLPSLYLLRSKRSGNLFRYVDTVLVDDVPLDYVPELGLNPTLFQPYHIFGKHPRSEPWSQLEHHLPEEVEVVRVACTGICLST